MEILLIRHGEKEDDYANTYSLELTSKGFKQAKQVAQRLISRNISGIFSSDMVRAKQTAIEISKATNVNIEYLHNLREIDMGICEKGWEGIEEINPEFFYKFHNHEDDVRYPEGENGQEVWNRVKVVLDDVVNEEDTTKVIVTHGGTIRCIIAGILGIPFEKRFMFGNPINNCSITTIKYDSKTGKYMLHSFNDSSHIGLD